MKKTAKFICLLLLIWCIIFGTQLIMDKRTLRNDLIRLHVVANSDSQQDQTEKVIVKDGIISYLQPKMKVYNSARQARNYIADHVDQLTTIANEILKEQNSDHRAKVTICTESFGKRDYDTFSLPSGVYESLRIEIGNAEGRNWWCVVFPSLCIPTSAEGFQAASASSGFDQVLTDTLSNNNAYEIRFLILDWIGQIENFFYIR